MSQPDSLPQQHKGAVRINRRGWNWRSVAIDEQDGHTKSIAFKEVTLKDPVFQQSKANLIMTDARTVSGAIRQAHAVSQATGRLALVECMGVCVPVLAGKNGPGGAGTDIALAEAYYETQKARVNEERRNSPAAIAAAESERRKLDERKQSIAHLITDLPAVTAKGQDAIVAWVGAFAGLNDHKGIEFDREAIATQLEATGLGSLDFDSLPPEKLSDFRKYTRDEYAQDIVTNAVLGLRERVGCMHPELSSRAENYARLHARKTPAPSRRGRGMQLRF
ncbi:MAG: hypothetical protein AB7Q01_07240 [Gammaproteobacteria bacterium]